VLPSARLLDPPGASTWRQVLRKDSSSVDSSGLTARLVDVLWQAARVEQFKQYVGNPDPMGPASTVYLYQVLQPQRTVAQPPRGPARPVSPAGLAGLSLLCLAVLVVAAAAWSRS
jgi:hypothetical protein